MSRDTRVPAGGMWCIGLASRFSPSHPQFHERPSQAQCFQSFCYKAKGVGVWAEQGVCISPSPRPLIDPTAYMHLFQNLSKIIGMERQQGLSTDVCSNESWHQFCTACIFDSWQSREKIKACLLPLILAERSIRSTAWCMTNQKYAVGLCMSDVHTTLIMFLMMCIITYVFSVILRAALPLELSLQRCLQLPVDWVLCL